MNVRTGQWVVVMTAMLALGAGAAGARSIASPSGTQAAASTAEAAAKATETYKAKCAMCHAIDGNSPLPNMSFADGVWKHGTTVKEMVNTISNGVPGTAMMPFKTQFTPEEIEALARHVRKFDKKLK